LEGGKQVFRRWQQEHGQVTGLLAHRTKHAGLAASESVAHAAHMCKNIKRIAFCAGSRCARGGGGIGSARRDARPVGGVAARSCFGDRGGGGGGSGV
jgi:hypothetical protein